jgi:hypothetical protein
MPLWAWIIFFAALVKIPVAALMLWIPYHYDESAEIPDDVSDSSEEDGGSKALPGGPRDPHPRAPRPQKPRPQNPRRGPHGSPSPPSPARVRTSTGTRPLRVSH